MSEYARSPVSDTCRLVMSELAAERGPDASADVAWAAGELLLREFEVDRRLGAGGFGSVTLVKSALTDCRYAMKTIKPELVARPHSRRAFAFELAMWIDLGAHPHVVRANFVRQIGATPALFMEYVTGGTLAEWIERGLVQDLDVIARIAGEIAAGLDFAHARGLVHADVKPENVLLGHGGAKVSDFGLAVAAGASAGGMTVTYRSPEQAAGALLTHATDVWSFGLTALAMFAGGPFWLDGQVAMAALQDFIDQPPPGRPPLPAAAQAALRRCFAPRPEDRWPSATEAARALFGRAAAPAVPAPTASAEEAHEAGAGEERAIGRWLLLAFELAGREARDARAQFPPRRATRAAQALADIDAFELAAPLLEQHAVSERLSEFHGDWADALCDIGDFSAALEHAEESVAALKRAEAPGPFALAAALRRVAFIALQCRRIMEAGPPLHEALQALGAMGEDGAAEGPATLLRPELGRPLLHELGLTYTDAAQWARLGQHFEGARACASLAVKACALAAAADPADASLLHHLARAHSEEATALKWLGQSAAAVESFQKAFELYAKSGHPDRIMDQRFVYSNALRDVGRLDDAMAEVQAAIDELTARSPRSEEQLNGAYHARAELLVRRDDWQGALADFERERRYFERLAYDGGDRGRYRLLAQAEGSYAKALERVGRDEEALPYVEHTIKFLERLRRAGDWGPLDRELSDAHALASACELTCAINGVRAHGRFPATGIHAAAEHASAAAEHGNARLRDDPDPEIALGAARLASSAASLFESLVERDRARESRALAREALDALDAMPGSPSAEAASLRRGLTESERDADLSFALVALLKGDGEGAVAGARRWGDAWLAKCIQFTASMFFLHEEPLDAAKAFGGLEAMRSLARSNRVEHHFLRGMGALFQSEQYTAIASFQAAAELAPDDPFVLFGLAYVCSRCGAPRRESEAAHARFVERASLHPLLRVVDIMLEWPPQAAGA